MYITYYRYFVEKIVHKIMNSSEYYNKKIAMSEVMHLNIAGQVETYMLICIKSIEKSHNHLLKIGFDHITDKKTHQI